MAEAPEPLVAALGRYVRSVPRPQLPTSLRRWHGWRQQALRRHGGELAAALDDEDTRDKVLEWLEGPVTLGGAMERALRLACERPDGWAEQLAQEAGVPPSESAEDGGAEAVGIERERARARRARASARAAREEGRARLAAERAQGARLEAEVREVRAQLESARAVAEGARAEAERAAEDRDRRVRRARREADKARSERDEARAALKRERRRVRALEGRVAALEGAQAEARARKRGGRGQEEERGRRGQEEQEQARRPRRPLKAPLGRLAEDPGTLSEWLGAAGVVLLVDGYNVTLAPGGFGELELPVQRERLVEAVERLVRPRRARATIVFDGSELPPGTTRRRRGGPVDVHYSSPGESGDDHLVAVLEALPPDPVVVVTDDRELRARVAPQGATVASSAQLLALLR
jgi:predicted RNA-binding protein with PIN domain